MTELKNHIGPKKIFLINIWKTQTSILVKEEGCLKF